MREKNSYVYFDPSVSIKKYSNTTHDVIFLNAPLSVMNPNNNGMVYKLNESAFEIVKLFDGTRTYNQIVEHFSNKFNEDSKSITNKIEACLGTLEKCGYSIAYSTAPSIHTINFTSFNTYYPTVASLEITNACNLRCRHCYGDYGNVTYKELSLNDAKKIIDHFVDIRLSILEITGGDPTVNRECTKIIQYALEAGIPKVMFLTNGVKIDDDLHQLLVKNKNRVYVQIDLHSLNEAYYEWFTGYNKLAEVKNNIQKLTKSGVKVRVCAIFTPGNVHELFDIAKWAYDNGAIYFAPSISINLGRAENELLSFTKDQDLLLFDKLRKQVCETYPSFIQNTEDPIYLNSIRRNNCGAIRSEISIDVEGNIRFCNMSAGQNMRLDIGNVLQNSIGEIFDQKKEFLDSLLGIIPPDMNSDTCRDCPNCFFCHSCILRGLIRGHQICNRESSCQWYQNLPNSFKSMVTFE